MKKIVLTSTLMALATASVASDDKHFKGKMPTTYEQAQEYLVESKAKLAAILADGNVSRVEMGEIHQLTYSLENALEFMEEEIEQIQETLERVHKGSERGTNAQVFQDAQQFLNNSDVLH
ncbi:DUF6746 family protein [Thiomicrorhabdus indica]|uniref:DUF6746 family protein n=1 Tax=Thiomicrorhabdus indica TaxID=2267253 RepID=UPI00102DF9DB|nr:DUF6746 family protein [Thiomicrorhabdus indica]